MTAGRPLTKAKVSSFPRAVLLVVAALALLGPPCRGAILDLHTATDGSGMPLALFDPPIPTPVWLHAAAAVDEQGALRRELMHPATVKELQVVLSQPAVGGCIPEGHVSEQKILSYPRGEDLDDILRVTPYVLLARVTGVAPGLSAATPGTLLRLELVRAVRGRWKSAGPYYVFMPIGRVPLGSKVVCKTDPQYSTLPALGDQVLCLTAAPSGEHQNLLWLESPGDLIAIHEGRLSYPRLYLRKLADDRGAHETLEDLLWRLDRYTLQQDGRPR